MEWSDSERLAWKPPDNLLVSEHAERVRVLGPPSEERGPLRLSRTPYLVPIMDAAIDPYVEEIVFCGPAQVAKTEFAMSVVSFFSDQEPCSILYVMADENTAKYVAEHRIQKMFRNSPALRGLIDETAFGIKEIALRNGAHIMLAWASSVSALASRPCRVVILDEIDKPGYSTTTREASPLSLAKERTATFSNRLILKTSTPTLDTGNVMQEMESCDAIFDWHVPCPMCGVFQPLRWGPEYCHGFKEGVYLDADGATRRALGRVKWDGGRHAKPEQIEAAAYECGACGALWTNGQKKVAVGLGKMVPREKIKRKIRKAGFHVNRLYSLLAKSGDLSVLVDDFIGCLDKPTLLQGFVNSALAEPWKQVIVDTQSLDVLRAKSELQPQTVPESAVALTCGIDVQKSGFWFAVRAWARDYTSWLIHHGFLPSIQDVEELLFGTHYPMIAGGQMRIVRAAMDTGGGEGQYQDGPSTTEMTYQWIRKNGQGRGCRVWGAKGASHPFAHGGFLQIGKPIDKTPSGKPLPGGLQIISVNTGAVKDMYHARLAAAIAGEGVEPAYLHAGTGTDYAAQIKAEEKRIPLRGNPEWVQVRRDNHLLDCECLAMAAADPGWPGGGVNLVSAPVGVMDAPARPASVQPPRYEPQRKKGGWING